MSRPKFDNYALCNESLNEDKEKLKMKLVDATDIIHHEKLGVCENNNNYSNGAVMTTANKEFTNYALPDDVLKEGITTLNTLLDQDLQKLKPEEYDFTFLNKVLTDSKLCGRFIWFNCGNIEKSLHQVVDTAKWRKEFGIEGIKRSDMQMFIIQEGVFFPSRFDVNGDRLIYLVIRKHFKNKEREMDNKKTYIYCKDRVLKKSPTNKITLVLDCSGAGLANADVGYIMIMADILIKHYPNTLGHAIVFDMPWIFNVFWNMIKILLPKHYREKVKFVNKETIQQYISKENLPKSMGGDDNTACDRELIESLYGPLNEGTL